jgi:FixJ family two-component response regulator
MNAKFAGEHRQSSCMSELVIFSDLTNPEINTELGVSLITVERERRESKAWLKTLF